MSDGSQEPDDEPGGDVHEHPPGALAGDEQSPCDESETTGDEEGPDDVAAPGRWLGVRSEHAVVSSSQGFTETHAESLASVGSSRDGEPSLLCEANANAGHVLANGA